MYGHYGHYGHGHGHEQAKKRYGHCKHDITAYNNPSWSNIVYYA